MRIKVDASDLLKWARYFNEIPKRNKRALARALNTFGEGVTNDVIRRMAEKNNWDTQDVASKIVIQRATPDNLCFRYDASLVIPASQQWHRPWNTRDDSEFEQNTLVKIVTMNDGYDCDVCRQVAEEGPYTMAQVVQMQAQWADYTPPTPNIHPGVITNLIHPRCRCQSQPWSSYRRLAISFQGQSGSMVSAMPAQLMTTKQLAKEAVKEMKLEISLLKRSISA